MGAMLWDLNEGKKLSSLDAKGEIHALCFSPNRYWLCGAVGEAIKIWDLETKGEVGILTTAQFKAQNKGRGRKQRRKGCRCCVRVWPGVMTERRCLPDTRT